MLSFLSIGIAIIVKNAEDTIAHAIRSAAGYARQIVVVDTGSTDRTPQICTLLGAEVHFFKWSDNFSEARNYALSLMRTEWILQLDADEELTGFSPEDIQQALTNPAIGGLQVELQNILAGGIESVHHYTRIFRRHPQIRYEGAIHEQIAGSIRALGLEIVESPVTILHHGYADNSPEKIERNAELLRREIALHPEDKWLSYHLGLTEFAAGRTEEARILLESVTSSNELTDEQHETARLRLAQIALQNGRTTDAGQWLNFTSNDIHREGLRCFILGSCFALERQFTDAVAMYSTPAVMASRLVNQQELHTFKHGISQFLN